MKRRPVVRDNSQRRKHTERKNNKARPQHTAQKKYTKLAQQNRKKRHVTNETMSMRMLVQSNGKLLQPDRVKGVWAVTIESGIPRDQDIQNRK